MAIDNKTERKKINDERQHKESDCDSEPAVDEIHITKHRNSASNQHEENPRQPGWNRWHKHPEHVFAACIVAFTLLLTASTIYQSCVMRGQLDEMIKGGVDTGKLVAATEKIAEAAKISAQSSLTVLNANIEASRLQERAWVGPTSFIRGPDVIKEGAQPSFGVVIANTGKTPARKMRVMAARVTLPKGASFKASYDIGGATSRGVLFPGTTASLTTNQEPRPLTAKQVEIITTGEFILYVYGVITYEDIFEVKHQTTFCGYRTTDLTSYKICSTYNEAS